MLQRSRFCHLFPDLGFVWHALTFQKLFVSPRTMAAFQQPDGPINWQQATAEDYTKLAAGGFIIGEGGDEAIAQIAKGRFARSEIQNLFLILTTECNLCCDYCFYHRKASDLFAKKPEMMDQATAYTAVDRFASIVSSNHRERPGYWEQITFYGGEPLLNRQCLESALDHIKVLRDKGQIWQNVELVVNTNGTLADREFARLAAREKLIIQISIDGPREIHDTNRFHLDGHGSFDSVMNAIGLLADEEATIMPMVTVNGSNISVLDEFIDGLCRQFDIKRYMMNVLMSTTEDNTPDYPVRAAKAMLATHRRTTEYGAFDENFAGTLANFGGPEISNQSCGGGRKITVFPNRLIHTCQALGNTDTTLTGSLDDFSQSNQNWQLWQGRNRFDNEICLSCPALGGCGGGCAAGSYHTNGHIRSIDYNQCEFTKYLFDHWIAGEIK